MMNTIETILFGAAMATYAIYRVINHVGDRKAARLQLQAADPYRTATPPEFQPTALQREPGPFKRCPACDAEPLRCNDCGSTRSDVEHSSNHQHVMRSTTGRWWRDGGPIFLTFAHGTSNTHVCSPWNRVPVGLFKRCNSTSIHVHQRCERCKWEGIAIVGAPPKED